MPGGGAVRLVLRNIFYGISTRKSRGKLARRQGSRENKKGKWRKEWGERNGARSYADQAQQAVSRFRTELAGLEREEEAGIVRVQEELNRLIKAE